MNKIIIAAIIAIFLILISLSGCKSDYDTAISRVNAESYEIQHKLYLEKVQADSQRLRAQLRFKK